MVKPRDKDSLRQLTPVYYFRMALPKDFSADADVVLEPASGESKRASFRIDRAERILYMVYYPEQERAGESIVLRLESPRQVQRVGRAPQ
jgi:hypothetical protein